MEGERSRPDQASRARDQELPGIVIRRGRPGDIDELVEIEIQAFGNDPGFAPYMLSRARFRAFMARKSATVIIAEELGDVVGYAIVTYSNRRLSAYLYSIAVAKNYRRKGVASLLLVAAEADAVGHACNRMFLETRFKDPGASNFYDQAGFAWDQTIPNFYGPGGTAIRYTKVLG